MNNTSHRNLLQTRSKLTGLLAAVLLGIASAGAAAQTPYPSGPITLVAPFAAGSGSDILARQLAKDLTASLGATIVVENKPGANGALGSQAVARAKPDGQTLLLGSATANAVNYAFFAGKLAYKPSSFDIVGGLATSPITLYVPFESPWQSVGDLVAAAKRTPASLSCGSGNAVTQVACEIFRQRTHTDAVNAPFQGNAQALTGVVGGQLSFAFSDPAAAQVLVNGKKLRALGVAGAQRSANSPNVPTFREQGVADFELLAWSAVFVPAGTPQAVKEKLNGAIRKSLESPEFVQLRTLSGGTAMALDLEQARSFLSKEIERWARYVEASGVKPEM